MQLFPQASPNSQSGGPSLQLPPAVEITPGEVLNNQTYMQPSPNNRELAGETGIGATQTAQEKSTEQFGVTFQEPLESKSLEVRTQ